MKLRFRLFFICLVLSLSLMAQRWDNYQPQVKVQLSHTNLPIVIINVDGTMIQRNNFIVARMAIIDNGAFATNYYDTLSHPNQHVDYDGYVAIRYRGSSSFSSSNKKPFTIHTLGQSAILPELGGKKEKVSLLGMAQDNNWALLAPFADKSMIRDVLSFELSRPWMAFTPHTRHCELVIDNVYYGVYVLTEKISKGKGRLNLPDPDDNGDMLTGGYILEVDRTDEQVFASKYSPVDNNGSPYWWNSIYFSYKFPDYQDLTNAQRTYIINRVNEMEKGFDSMQQLSDIENQIDVMSFIDYQLAKEFGHDVDGYRLSGKFYKDRDANDGRFKMALWDMNLAYGNADYYGGWRTDTWIYESNPTLSRSGDTQLVPFWWYKLNQDSLYVAKVRERWAQYRNANFNEATIMLTIDSLVNVLCYDDAESRNSQAWNRWGQYVWPNYYVSKDFNDEIDYLKQWISKRLAWMDKQLHYDPTQSTINQPSTERFAVEYYSIDGRVLTQDALENYHGIVIVKYSDGSTSKIIRN